MFWRNWPRDRRFQNKLSSLVGLCKRLAGGKHIRYCRGSRSTQTPAIDHASRLIIVVDKLSCFWNYAKTWYARERATQKSHYRKSRVCRWSVSGVQAPRYLSVVFLNVLNYDVHARDTSVSYANPRMQLLTSFCLMHSIVMNTWCILHCMHVLAGVCVRKSDKPTAECDCRV